jgi:hypothetical protein
VPDAHVTRTELDENDEEEHGCERSSRKRHLWTTSS